MTSELNLDALWPKSFNSWTSPYGK